MEKTYWVKHTCDCDKFPIIPDKSFPVMEVWALSSLQHFCISFFTVSMCSLLRPTIVMSKVDIFLSNTWPAKQVLNLNKHFFLQKKKFKKIIIHFFCIDRKREFMISFEPISKRLTPNSTHELSMSSVWIDVIGAFLAGNEKSIVLIDEIFKSHIR